MTEVEMTKADKVRKYMAENPKASAKEIAEKIGVNLQYVYDIKSKIKKAKKRKYVRRFPTEGQKVLRGVLVDTTQERTISILEKEVTRLNKELDGHWAVIQYLESKLAKNGVAV